MRKIKESKVKEANRFDMSGDSLMNALLNKVDAEELLKQIVGDFLSGKYRDSMIIELQALYTRYIS